MKRGPKPKPTALKVLEGVHPFRINGDEPPFPPGSAAAPDWLAGLAREQWDELAPLLAESRVLTVGDRSNLALLCLLYQRWREDPADLKAINQYVRLSLEFGLTPSSRSRLKAAPERPKDEVQALDEFLGGRKAQ
jgi:phage terminase small subunit